MSYKLLFILLSFSTLAHAISPVSPNDNIQASKFNEIIDKVNSLDSAEGIPGPQGPAGIQGAIGPQGPAGIQGPKGDTGNLGPQGPQGLTGLTGPQGPTGLKGDKGDQGIQGVQGPQGPAGADAVITFTAPTIQRLTSGSGTYTRPAGVKYIKIKMVGGGGGGEGSSTDFGGAGPDGTTGGHTIFGTNLLTAYGGMGGVYAAVIVGGEAIVSAPAIKIIAVEGGNGQSTPGFWSQGAIANTMYIAGGMGGSSAFAGAGSGPIAGAGGAAKLNSGSGGGGGGITSVPTGSAGSRNPGAGGGAGGYIEAMIVNPSATYSYSIGAGGNAGGAGTGGFSGGAGGSGLIVVEEFYQ